MTRLRPAMALTILLVAGLGLTAGLAAAQESVRLTAKLFVSPSGQPFRAKTSEPYPVTKWLEQVDTDKDGVITWDEFHADAESFFLIVDANHDGVINSPENVRYETTLAPEIQIIDPRVKQPKIHLREPDPNMGVDQDPTRGRYIKQIVGAAQYGLIDEPQPIRAADADFNYRISPEEWEAQTGVRFDLLDADADGKIVIADLPQTPLQYGLEQAEAEGGERRGLFGN